MAIILHKNINDDDKHTPKGFDTGAGFMFMCIKDENGESTYVKMPMLPAALNFVDGTLAPPTNIDGHIYVLTGSGTVHVDWNGADFNDWVRYDGTVWNRYTPADGIYCDDQTADQLMRYSGVAWVAAGGDGVANLSEGTVTNTTVDVNSDTGTNATLQEASTTRAGVMSKAKWDEVEANNAKVSNVSTDLSEGTVTTTSVEITSSDGLNAALLSASASRAGVMPSAKFSEVEANNSKVSNATHSGDANGDTALTLQPAAITGKTAGTVAGGDLVLISDIDDSNNLKKVTAQSIADLGGGAAVDVFGISDGSGGYTYYATLALAIAGASSGDTIQQFADVTETVSSNALPVNVHWNLNGYKYEKTAGSYAISVADGQTARITNGRIFANGSGNCIDANANNAHIYCDGLTLQSTGEVVRSKGHGFAGTHWYNATIIGTSSTVPMLNAGEYIGCNIRNLGTAITANACSEFINCEIVAISSNAITDLKGTAYNSFIISKGSVACSGPTFRAKNCTIESTASNAIDATTVQVEKCRINSTAGTGITLASPSSFVVGCVVNGTSIDYGIRTVNNSPRIEDTVITNSAGKGIDAGANAEIVNCVINVTFNSAAGHGIVVANGITAGNEPVIVGTAINLANTGANYLNAAAVTRANYANLSSSDKLNVTTAVNANITQGRSIISDAQGNNL